MKRDIFTTYEVSRFANVDLSTVVNWIENGKLKAYRTPGGHRRIKKEDLLKFLEEYNMPISNQLEKADRTRVLIVDDEVNIRNIIMRVIRKTKPEVDIETASDGFEAGITISEFEPDLVILDIKLPGIDGYKVCRDIKSNPNTKDIKILAITGDPTPDAKRKIIACGADGFLAKPFNISELINKLSHLTVC